MKMATSTMGYNSGMQQKTNDLRQSAQQAAGQVKETVKEGASEMLDGLRDMGDEVAQRARQGYETVRDSTADCMDQGRAKAREWEASIEHQIRAQPLTSLLVAVGVGFLVGAIWSRT